MARRVGYGLTLTFPDPRLALLAAQSGLGFVLLDCEHGVVDERGQMAVLAALSTTSTLAFVRLRTQDPQSAAHYVEFGCDGVLIPDVRNEGQAQAVVRAVRRATASPLRSLHRRTASGQPTFSLPLTLPMIESGEGAANIASILAVDGVDGAVVGPDDLSHSLGVQRDGTSPEYLGVLGRIEAAAHARGKMLGSKPHGPHTARLLEERGYELILIERDLPLIASALRRAIGAASEAPGV